MSYASVSIDIMLFQSYWEMEEMREKCKQMDTLRIERNKLKKHFNVITSQHDCLVKENAQMKCIIQDQDDEIRMLIDRTEKLAQASVEKEVRNQHFKDNRQMTTQHCKINSSAFLIFATIQNYISVPNDCIKT